MGWKWNLIIYKGGPCLKHQQTVVTWLDYVWLVEYWLMAFFVWNSTHCECYFKCILSEEYFRRVMKRTRKECDIGNRALMADLIESKVTKRGKRESDGSVWNFSFMWVAWRFLLINRVWGLLFLKEHRHQELPNFIPNFLLSDFQYLLLSKTKKSDIT